MLKRIWEILFNKSFEDKLIRVKKIRINGLKFFIKKIDPLNYLDGSQALLKVYDTYHVKKEKSEMSESDLKKVRAHFKDVFLASVISPKLARNESDEGFFVDKLFVEWDLCNKLYEEIVVHTYGKKKLL